MPGSRTNSAPLSARVLLVDDEALFRLAAVVAMLQHGYRAEEAADGKEALGKVLAARQSGDPFRLVVTDIRMPVMSGLELIDALREERVDTRVCAITGFGEPDLVGELAGKGCTDYIEKPFPPEVLLARVGKILERAGG